MNRYDIIKHADKIPYIEVKKYLEKFIENCILKVRKERWYTLINSPQKIYQKFNSLWNHLDLAKLIKNVTYEELEKYEKWYWFYNMDDFAYKIQNKDIKAVCDNVDGFLFGSSSNLIVFLTHEGDNYLYK
ncbi:MAG: hypothetical protein ACMUJM_25335 [bacterium]